MTRSHNTVLRFGLLGAVVRSALVLFLDLSRVQFGEAWRSTWQAAGFDPHLVAALSAAAWGTALWVHNLYRVRSRRSIRSEVRDVLRADLSLAVATFAVLFPFKPPDVSRRFVITVFAAQFVATTG